jgi:hypothetical protein
MLAPNLARAAKSLSFEKYAARAFFKGILPLLSGSKAPSELKTKSNMSVGL